MYCTRRVTQEEFLLQQCHFQNVTNIMLSTNHCFCCCCLCCFNLVTLDVDYSGVLTKAVLLPWSKMLMVVTFRDIFSGLTGKWVCLLYFAASLSDILSM